MHEDAVRVIAIAVTSVATTTPCIKGSKGIGLLWVLFSIQKG
jgi:hypothetical protein